MIRSSPAYSRKKIMSCSSFLSNAQKWNGPIFVVGGAR
uniref:Uncharacterized protein n=1 Tax=Arundo donax TaxID=35708 RepID=A0A0A8ZBH1_ARUDO